MRKFDFSKIEKKWQEVWEEEGVYRTPRPSKKNQKMYVLEMFPYPSGSGLHTGHVRVYTGGDVLARFFRMKGYAVLHPMGWDAFGLPAENRAIKEKTTPQKIVPKNIANFKRQMKMLGFSYDWEREFSTTDPEYYRFTQWLFIQFFKMGLLYKKEMPVYFCPSCKTGLAEEEVLPDGTHERCGNPITRKMLPQWVFKITDYAESLLEGLKGLDWPEGIKKMQENWIGRSEGTEVKFKVQSSKFKVDGITVFTTRVDTIFGVTALVLAPEHPLVEEILNSNIKIRNKDEIKKYVEEAKKKLDLVRTDLSKEKTGVFTGLYAKHPLTGEKVPIWIADYVLGFYGEGAVMLVPAHDERDYEFAKKYGIPIKVVVIPEKNSKFKVQNSKLQFKIKNCWREGAFTDYGVLVNSGDFSGLSSQQAIKEITKYLEQKGLGGRKIQYKLRDWIFSRQRYWGEPIPMVYCRSCAEKKISFWDLPEGKKWLEEIKHNTPKLYQKISKKIEKLKKNLYGWFPLKEEELPLELPEVEKYEPTGTGESPLAALKGWVETKCPVCGSKAKRETDTMPNWAGSCWYFLRFAQNPKLKVKNAKLEEVWQSEIKNLRTWLPVDWYIGGAEHAVLHLLYSRFWMHALYDLGLVPTKEPFYRLRNVGMVLAEDGRKMSKSLGNVVNPDDVVKEFGADTLRMYEMFMAPFDQEIAWSKATLKGLSRFLSRVWQIFNSSDNLTEDARGEDKELVAKLYKTIKRVEDNITDVKFNTAIAAMMEFLNAWTEKNALGKPKKLHVERAKKFLQILAPFAPFLTEEIWKEKLGERNSIHLSKWPEVSSEYLKETVFTIPVQVDGKLRLVLRLKEDELEEENVVKKALESQKVRRYLENKKYKVVYVKGKILNFVLLD